MFFLYILKSQKGNRLYVGVTNDIEGRLIKHSKGQVKSTKSRRPFTLVFKKEFPMLGEARKYEWMLKYTPGGGKLKKRLAGEITPGRKATGVPAQRA